MKENVNTFFFKRIIQMEVKVCNEISVWFAKISSKSLYCISKITSYNKAFQEYKTYIK